MKDIKLSEYQNTSIYFYLFDVVIKNQNLNKDEFLISIGISPTSYRRARKSEQAIGHEIIKILADYFNYRLLTNEEISNMEILFTNIYNDMYYKCFIYNDMYYKCFDNYDSYMNTLDHEIATNSILFPILYDFKAFMMFNKILKPEEEKKAFDIYKENKCYENFFNFQLKNIFEIYDIFFLDDFQEYYSINDFDDGLKFYIISSIYVKKNDVIKFFYYADIAKNYFLKDNNFMRILYLNNTYMNVYSKITDFQSCYNLAKSQHLSLKGIGKICDISDNALAYFTVSCIALKKYSEILSILDGKIKLLRTVAYCKLVALYMLKEKEYEEARDELLSKSDENEASALNALDSYLKKHDEKSLNIIENSSLKMNFSGALKMIFK